MLLKKESWGYTVLFREEVNSNNGFGMDYPRCDSGRRIKNGFIKGAQRYKCKECNYQYTRLE